MKDKKKSILVVDDSVINIQVIANFLQAEGYDLKFATDDKEAMQILKNHDPDLILLDIVMPGIDGFEICKKLSSDPAYRDIPILFLTVKTDPESIVKGFESGAVDYITKPFQPYELLARIRTHLRLRSVQFQLKENNIRLMEEISFREKIQRQLKNLNAELEYKIRDRTKHIYKLAGMIDNIGYLSVNNNKGYEPVRIDITVKEAVKVLKTFIPSSVEIICNIMNTATISAGHDLMHRIIMGLCINSYEALENERGYIRIKLLTENDHMKLSIEDNGRKFFENSLKRTGPGLVIVKRLVNELNGKFELYTNKGITRFTVYLPCIDS
ncbi:MAG: response regulator [Candidatus Delongbacteria bacterium]